MEISLMDMFLGGLITIILFIVLLIILSYLTKRGFVPGLTNLDTHIGIFKVSASFQKDAKSTKPDVTISERWRQNKNVIYLNIKNVGVEDIENFRVEFKYQKDTPQSRYANQFFHPDQDPTLTRSEVVVYLDAGDMVMVAGVPNTTDDGKLEVVVTGTGIFSKSRVIKNKVLEVKTKP